MKADGLEVRTRLEKAKYDALSLRDQLATQKEQLNQLLGRDAQTEFSVGPVPAISGDETDLAAAREQALRRRPEIKEARLKVKYAEYDRKIKKSEQIPVVARLRMEERAQLADTKNLYVYSSQGAGARRCARRCRTQG